MGMFSFNCSECNHPMLSVGATNDINYWMNGVVAITPDNYKVIGSYDGYGRIDVNEWPEPHTDFLEEESVVWLHESCYIVSGSKNYSDYEPSENAMDQGYFFNDGDHNLENPLKEEEELSDPPIILIINQLRKALDTSYSAFSNALSASSKIINKEDYENKSEKEELIKALSLCAEALGRYTDPIYPNENDESFAFKAVQNAYKVLNKINK